MAVSEFFSGTETVDTTEWSLSTDTAGPDAQTTAGQFQLFVDFSALTVTEQYQLRVYEKAISGGTQRVVDEWTINGPVSAPIWYSPQYMLLNGWDFTLDKIAGTAQSISWSIRIDTDSAIASNVSAIKTQTDKFVFTVANQVDSNVQYVNDVQVTGTGASGNEWGPV